MCTGGLKQEFVLQRETLNLELRPVIYDVTLWCDCKSLESRTCIKSIYSVIFLYLFYNLALVRDLRSDVAPQKGQGFTVIQVFFICKNTNSHSETL